MEKIKILLCCSAGMSTSLLVNKIIEAGKETNFDVECEAVSINRGKEIGKEWDIILLGPQVRYELKYFKDSKFPKPFDVIPPQYYALANGKAVLEFALGILGKK